MRRRRPPVQCAEGARQVLNSSLKNPSMRRPKRPKFSKKGAFYAGLRRGPCGHRPLLPVQLLPPGWLEAIAGIRDRSASDHVPGWALSPCRLPRPVPRYVQVFVGFSPPRLQRAPLPSARKGMKRHEKVVTVKPLQARCMRGNPMCGVVQCTGQSSVRARCAGQLFKLVFSHFLLIDQRGSM